MGQLASKILIIGVPLALSLSWFVFWVVRLTRAAKRLKGSRAPSQEEDSVSPDPPVHQSPVEGG
jgi:hypothetical protein